LRRRYRDGWFKVSRRIVDSSLWAEDPLVLKVWLFLLEQSQAGRSLKPGTVIISRAVLAGRCLITPEQLDAAIERLSSPDPESRTSRAEGRRVVVLPNGFRLVNHGEYHDVEAEAHLSETRRVLGRTGGLVSGQSRKAQQDQSDKTKQNPSKAEANAKQTRDKRQETEKETTAVMDLPAAPADPTPGERSPRRALNGTPAQREALDRCARVLGRTLTYSKANVDAITRAQQHYTGEQVARVLTAIHNGTTPTARWCQERLSDGLDLAYMLRPGEKGAADRVLEQLERGDSPRMDRPPPPAPPTQAAQAREEAAIAEIRGGLLGREGIRQRNAAAAQAGDGGRGPDRVGGGDGGPHRLLPGSGHDRSGS
jgi:hypothetical protein